MLLHKLLLSLFLLFCVVNAKEYPQTFSQLGTPLYLSAEKFSAFSDISSLSKPIEGYINDARKTQEKGLDVDANVDAQVKKEYLLELRKLQKNYEYTLHLLHKEIEKSIDKEDYKSFVKLTSCELDGLLAKSNLQKKALSFYAKHKHKHVCRVLDKKIKNQTLLEETTEEFYNEIVQSTYSSNANDTTVKKSLYIVTSREKNRVHVSFKNTNLYDVTVSVKRVYNNIRESENTPREFVVKAKSTFAYTTLNIGYGKTSYSFSYSWIIGNKDAKHQDDYLYRFPYEIGTFHRISQGYNGRYTHKGSSQYALDFVMDVGTKICAARNGIVIRTKEDSNSGGYDKKYASSGNYVTIAHDDGTMGTYYHLKRGGVIVNVGEYVSRGRTIGYSGNTGYSSGPHLHFAVFRARNAHATETLPVKFIDEDGVVDTPSEGRAYKAH